MDILRSSLCSYPLVSTPMSPNRPRQKLTLLPTRIHIHGPIRVHFRTKHTASRLPLCPLPQESQALSLHTTVILVVTRAITRNRFQPIHPQAACRRRLPRRVRDEVSKGLFCIEMQMTYPRMERRTSLLSFRLSTPTGGIVVRTRAVRMRRRRKGLQRRKRVLVLDELSFPFFLFSAYLSTRTLSCYFTLSTLLYYWDFGIRFDRPIHALHPSLPH